MKAAVIILFLVSAAYCEYQVVHDCGLMSLLRGSEWLWLFGGCK